MLDGRYDPALALLIVRETADTPTPSPAADEGALLAPGLAALMLAALVLLPALCAGVLQ